MSFTKHVVPPKHTSDSSNELIGVYQRKTYDVEAVQVTIKNMEEIAKWCGGELKWDYDDNDRRSGDYIEIPVSNANKPSVAKIKDWVLKIPNAGKNRKDVFAIYNEYAFGRAFDAKPREVTDEELVEAVVKVVAKEEETVAEHLDRVTAFAKESFRVGVQTNAQDLKFESLVSHHSLVTEETIVGPGILHESTLVGEETPEPVSDLVEIASTLLNLEAATMDDLMEIRETRQKVMAKMRAAVSV